MGKQNSLTESAAMPLVSEGEGASAPSLGLTINQKRLGDLFLPSIKDDFQALDWMSKAMRRCKSVESPNFQALSWARVALQNRHENRVKSVCERGGLLLIGGVMPS